MPFIHIAGKELYYTWSQAKATGEQPGLTLLFIHGLGSSSSFYATIIPGLLQSGFSCLAVDTYGSGLSKFTGQDQDTRTIAQDARQLLSTLGVDPGRTIVVGHSMGCIVASELASDGNFAGMVLLGAINPDPKYHVAFSKRIETVRAQGMEAMADTIPTAATGPKSNSVHHAFIRALLLSQTSDGYVSLCNAIVSARRPDYARIRCPVLVVAGEEDKTASLGDSKEIISSLATDAASVQLEILPGVGHWHCIEGADEVRALVTEFGKRIAATIVQK